MSSPHYLFERIKTIVGLDFHILYTLLLRGWTVLAGGLSIVLIPIFLSPTQQGFYYTFASVLALQVFFELGLNQIIVQLVSHEAAHLTIHEDGTIIGDAARMHRLNGLVALLRRWYTFAALLFGVLAGGAGWVFFVLKGVDLPVEQWGIIWFALVLFTSINLFLSPLLAVVEGTGQVGAVARLRLIQSIVGYAFMWTLLLFDTGLWVAVAVPAVGALITSLWLGLRGGMLRQESIANTMGLEPISWRRDVFPLQWRIAISWACGYFIFSLFTPIVFARHGAVEAGRLGMAMSVFSSITALGLSWINAKAPNFTMHISRGESDALNQLFQAVALRSIVATGLPSFVIVTLVALCNHFDVVAVNRIAPAGTLFWIACAATANTAVYAAALYMRAHREEPMLPVSVVSALATVACIFLLRDDVNHMMLGYAAVCSLLGLPWTWFLLNTYRVRHMADTNTTSNT
jgi:hypothetical protein